MYRIFTLIVLVLPLWAVSYSEPETLLRLSNGSGEYQVALRREGVALGPCRLLAVSSSLYLLDQLNKRIIVYDTLGRFIKQIQTPFSPVDMAVDSSGRVWVLENRTQPAEIRALAEEVLKKDEEVFLIPYTSKQPITAILIHQAEGLLVFSGNKFCTLHSNNTRLSEYCADDYLEFKEADINSLKALQLSTPQVFGVEISCSEGSTSYFLAASSKLLWIAEECYSISNPNSLITRYIKVFSKTNKTASRISLPQNAYSYNTAWRNVSVDKVGNIYAFISNEEGEACILKWSINISN